ncbi:iron-sulfur cluster co-chaperone HscB C-terminal domain-containing protein [Flaviaesturariibacter amylovorans]|uniref:Co-chaperone HscB n=1 Tax=Flaviaesturariibacter amylovorans TaxID=1084520 RepID=A0ABP8GR05_9BACT
MNYFELFGLPVQLRTDKVALRKRFFELSRAAHPDYFAQADAATQADALDRSAQLNKAYKTLGDDDALLGYVLQEKGLLTPDEKYALPPDFLMEMMELNESVPETQADDAARARLAEQLNQWQNEIYAPVANIVEGYQEGVTSEEELLQVKAYYYKKKYLQRLAAQLGQKP